MTSPNQTVTFDNGLQVEIGRQIAEGGFSYVFEAFPVGHVNGTVVAAPPGTSSNSSSRVMLSQRSSSSTTNMTESTTDSTAVVRHHHRNHVKKYALKRINCSDHEIVQSCRQEAGIHRSLPSLHPNLLELLGLKFDNNNNNLSKNKNDPTTTTNETVNMMIHNEYNVCYMLFPHIPYSLRGEITKRNILNDVTESRSTRQPFATKEILQLFGGLIDALTAMHNANISHRDVKLENVLLELNGYNGDDTARSNSNASRRGRRTRFTYTPILMDFGSAGPLTTTQLHSRQDILTIVENAASHTTMPYRPPELFEGGITTIRRHHGGNTSREMYLDYGKVDVW